MFDKLTHFLYFFLSLSLFYLFSSFFFQMTSDVTKKCWRILTPLWFKFDSHQLGHVHIFGLQPVPLEGQNLSSSLWLLLLDAPSERLLLLKKQKQMRPYSRGSKQGMDTLSHLAFLIPLCRMHSPMFCLYFSRFAPLFFAP